MRQYAGTLNRSWLALLGALTLLGGLYVIVATPLPMRHSYCTTASQLLIRMLMRTVLMINLRQLPLGQLINYLASSKKREVSRNGRH